MKSRYKLAGLSALLLAVGIILSVQIFIQRHTVYPTQENESVFLKNYAPRSIVKRFESNQFKSQWSSGMGTTPGREFATFRGGFQGWMEIRPEQWVSLMNALNDDASQLLVRNKAQILSQSGSPSDGFRLEYKLGKSVGSLIISPLKIDNGLRSADGTIPVVLDIAFEEKYFRQEPGLMSVNRESPALVQHARFGK